MNRKTNDKYFLKDVFDQAIDFLHDHPSESVIMHLKDDAIEVKPKESRYIESNGKVQIIEYNGFNKMDEVYQKIANLSILNKEKIHEKEYNGFFYKGKDNFPVLGKVGDSTGIRGKIVLWTRNDFKYNNNDKVGTTVAIPGMGDCKRYPTDGDKCYPRISNSDEILVQDAYNIIDADDKCDLINSILSNNIDVYTPKGEIYDSQSSNVLKFYGIKNHEEVDIDSVLTLDFANIQGVFDATSIQRKSEYINDKLSELFKVTTMFYHHWFVLDYPTDDLIYKIQHSTSIITKEKRSINNDIMIDDFLVSSGIDYYIVSTKNACLQRRTVKNQQGYEEDLIKTNYKCVDNKKNKWRVVLKGDYYNIQSSYDAKCLTYFNNRLSINYCDDNQNKQFSFKNGKICSRNSGYCLDNKFQVRPTVITSSRYEHLTCSSNYLRAGYQCCRNQYAKVEKVDDFGNWAKENGEWCGIGYERCPFEVLGYHCCSSVNPKVVKEDEYGKWGEEDGQLCGIGEMNRVVLFRIRNVKTKQCILVNNSDGNLIDLGECTTSNHSLWHVTNVDEYNNKRITSDKNGKCLYAANACTSGLEVCENVMNIKDRYMHFEFVEDKYLCVKNNRNQKYNCLSSKTLNFEETYDKNDQSFQWEIQDIDGGVITRKETDPYNPDRNHDLPKDSPDNTSTSDCPVDDYPCCSPEITEVAYTDEKGTWGIENDGWCFISGSTSTPKSSEPTTTVNTTTTTISSTVSTSSKATPTIKSGHTVYWFYHAFTNKCLYAPQEPNNPITVKPCDDTDYSKWMVLPSRKGYFYSMAQLLLNITNYC